MATRKIFRTAWPLAALILAPLPAAALFNDRVEVFAGENVTYDSNLLRLSKDVDPRPFTGSDSRSDWISTTSVGASLDVPWSLQRFQASYTWFRNRYRDFSQLDYDGHTARAAWLWSVTPHLTGDLGYTDSRTLANFANFLVVPQHDILDTRQAFANAVWFPVASWRLHAGGAWVEQTHSDTLQRVNDIRSNTGVVGASYVTPEDDRIGVEGRFERGRSPHDEIVPTTGFTNGYHQDSAGIVGHWIATGHSILDARVDWVRRHYDQPTTADFSGPTARAAHTWTPTGKLTIVSSIYRDVGPIVDVQSANFVLVKGVAVKPAWQATDKIAITGDAEYNVWDYRGNLLTGFDYTHRVRTFGVGLSYRPTQKILVQTGYSHEMRTSTVPFADYKDDIFNVSARIGF
jgi:exopolysaccharide biosynthesis operon protein EpsL